MDMTEPPLDAAALVNLARAARHAKDCVELEFMAVNASHALVPYRQAALWLEDRGICALSGVVQIEANAPYVQWLEKVCPGLRQPGPIFPADLAPEFAGEWEEWLPPYGLWLPFSIALEDDKVLQGGLLLARDIPWMEHELPALEEWVDAWQHAYKARMPRIRWSLASLKTVFGNAANDPARPWWKRRAVVAAAAVCAVLVFPVRLTVLAPGELVAANPSVVRSPLDGVVERFHIKPNQSVKKGDPLFDFDEAQLASRYAVAEQALATAEAEYRQTAQQALSDNKFKSQLAVLQGKIEERRAEMEFLRGQVERAHVVAPRDGIVLIDDPSEWTGKPVSTGERILRVADPREAEVEAWLPIGDAIPIDPGATVHLYLSASPLSPVIAEVRYVSYDAMQRPDGSYAYRVRAKLAEPTSHRIGMKGTARVNGHWAPLAYWLLRRPVAFIRQTLGW
jgi:multidrug resistance efflux pump